MSPVWGCSFLCLIWGIAENFFPHLDTKDDWSTEGNLLMSENLFLGCKTSSWVRKRSPNVCGIWHRLAFLFPKVSLKTAVKNWNVSHICVAPDPKLSISAWSFVSFELIEQLRICTQNSMMMRGIDWKPQQVCSLVVCGIRFTAIMHHVCHVFSPSRIGFVLHQWNQRMCPHPVHIWNLLTRHCHKTLWMMHMLANHVNPTMRSWSFFWICHENSSHARPSHQRSNSVSNIDWNHLHDCDKIFNLSKLKALWSTKADDRCLFDVVLILQLWQCQQKMGQIGCNDNTWCTQDMVKAWVSLGSTLHQVSVWKPDQWQNLTWGPRCPCCGHVTPDIYGKCTKTRAHTNQKKHKCPTAVSTALH